jgi:hypothetical protein
VDTAHERADSAELGGGAEAPGRDLLFANRNLLFERRAGALCDDLQHCVQAIGVERTRQEVV